jgi:DNA-binding NtrC family response regulator
MSQLIEGQKIVEYYPDKPLDQAQKEYIEGALIYWHGHKQKAADALGISVKTIFNHLHRWGLFEKYKLQMGPAKKIKVNPYRELK